MSRRLGEVLALGLLCATTAMRYLLTIDVSCAANQVNYPEYSLMPAPALVEERQQLSLYLQTTVDAIAESLFQSGPVSYIQRGEFVTPAPPELTRARVRAYSGVHQAEIVWLPKDEYPEMWEIRDRIGFIDQVLKSQEDHGSKQEPTSQ